MHYLVLFLEALFFVGLVGSMVVAIWAFIGDFHEFFEKDRTDASQTIGD
jgi:hypothetical protein